MSADPDVPLASEALLRPVRPGNAFEDTVGRLLQTIRLGVLQPGESLPPERELAARSSVSAATPCGRRSSRWPTPAIWCPVAAGTAAPSWPTSCRGTPDDSAGVTRAEIDDALRLREILEVGAARMAANRTLTAAEREVLWSRLADVRGAAPDDYRRLDSRLHLAIAEAAGSPSLVPLVAENRMRLNGLLDQIPLLPRNIAHSDEQHEAIVVAILAGDCEGAAAAMLAHVAGSAALCTASWTAGHRASMRGVCSTDTPESSGILRTLAAPRLRLAIQLRCRIAALRAALASVRSGRCLARARRARSRYGGRDAAGFLRVPQTGLRRSGLLTWSPCPVGNSVV